MTSTCRESCCSATPRLTVSELFERGFRRSRLPPFGITGETCSDAEGYSARFNLEMDKGRVARVGFRASSCATLIAYSELIAEVITGARPDIAAAMTADDLITMLPSVHPLKQARAVLACAALRAALAAAETKANA
jgi:NifU-like protein involved in Fe-S cluster formation